MLDASGLPDLELLTGQAVFDRVQPDEICRLTRRATDVTFRSPNLTLEQTASVERNIETSGPICLRAAAGADQHLVAALVRGQFAGFVVCTRHATKGLELDWLMVDPQFHGAGCAARLMDAGLDWLGRENPVWLNVIKTNERAIRFYRRYGFEIDPAARTDHAIPNWIMRRSGDRAMQLGVSSSAS